MATRGAILSVVRRAAIIATLVVLVAILLAGPVYEQYDKWDNIPQTGNDTVLSLVCLATCLGALLTLTRYVVIALALLCRIFIRESSWKIGKLSFAQIDGLSPGPPVCLSPLRI